jgi:HK97 gp10 family phage protein
MALEGVAALTRQLDELGKAVKGKALRGAVRTAANVVKKAAQARVPVGTEMHKTYKGRLVAPGFAQRSVRVVTKLDRTGEKASAAIGVRREAFYAVQFLELGTSKLPARPWLRPAMSSTQVEQQRAIGKALKRAIEREARKRSGGAK